MNKKIKNNALQLLINLLQVKQTIKIKYTSVVEQSAIDKKV